MSEQQLKAFISKIQGDPLLQERLKAAQLESAAFDPIAIAKDVGFSITSEDLELHRQNLSDQELEAAGGGNVDKEPCCCSPSTFGTLFGQNE